MEERVSIRTRQRIAKPNLGKFKVEFGTSQNGKRKACTSLLAQEEARKCK